MVRRWADMQPMPVEMAGAEGVTKRLPVLPSDGWHGWAMRIFELAPGGHTPHHAHPWPHINLVLGGEGRLLLDGEEHAIAEGDSAVVPAGAEHQFRAAGDSPFRFVCIVPEEGEA